MLVVFRLNWFSQLPHSYSYQRLIIHSGDYISFLLVVDFRNSVIRLWKQQTLSTKPLFLVTRLSGFSFLEKTNKNHRAWYNITEFLIELNSKKFLFGWYEQVLFLSDLDTNLLTWSVHNVGAQIKAVFLSYHIRVWGESTLCNCLNVKKSPSQIRRDICKLSDYNATRTYNHLIRKEDSAV